MPTNLLTVAMATAILAGSTAPAAVQDENEREYLIDLREVNVFVDDLALDAEAAGLTRAGIEAAVEARLRERGVPLGRSQLAGDLYVRVGTHRSTTGLYAYFARVSLQQLVTIDGNQERAFVDTWDLDSLGTVGRGQPAAGSAGRPADRRRVHRRLLLRERPALAPRNASRARRFGPC